MDLIQRENKAIFQTYKRLEIQIESAEGLRVKDTQGNVYLDFLGGIAVNVLGHSHPKLIQAINEQIHKYMHVSNYFYQEPQIKLAEKLKECSQMDRIFFTNSGSEATEGAVKLVKKWGSDRGKSQIISFSGGFHGRTYGALSMMQKPLYMDGMGPFLDDRLVLEYNNVEELEKNVNKNTAALYLEFLQGEGGLTEVSVEFVKKIKELKSKYNFLVVADEIQSGIGRTGKFSFYEHFDIQVDIITLAKGLGGGLPLGAFLAKEEVASVWSYGQHGTTFGGNAVSCAAGLVVLQELYENSLSENIKVSGEYLKAGLKSLKNKYPDMIDEIRGQGLMLGVKLKTEARSIVDKLLEHFVITNSTSVDVLRLLPPYTVTKTEIDEFLEKLEIVLKK